MAGESESCCCYAPPALAYVAYTQCHVKHTPCWRWLTRTALKRKCEIRPSKQPKIHNRRPPGHCSTILEHTVFYVERTCKQPGQQYSQPLRNVSGHLSSSRPPAHTHLEGVSGSTIKALLAYIQIHKSVIRASHKTQKVRAPKLIKKVRKINGA